MCNCFSVVDACVWTCMALYIVQQCGGWKKTKPRGRPEWELHSGNPTSKNRPRYASRRPSHRSPSIRTPSTDRRQQLCTNNQYRTSGHQGTCTPRVGTLRPLLSQIPPSCSVQTIKQSSRASKGPAPRESGPCGHSSRRSPSCSTSSCHILLPVNINFADTAKQEAPFTWM